MIREKLYVFFKGIHYFLKSYRILSEGQDPKYAILQNCHRIEKGLLLDNPKPGWGWEKINAISNLMVGLDDCFEKRVAQSTINKYIESKRNSENPLDKENIKSFVCIQENEDLAGIEFYSFKEMEAQNLDAVKNLFSTRHSIRDFDSRIVPHYIINEAIALANRCPSACNRQLTKVYVVPGEKRRELYSGDIQGITPPYFLLITGNARAFAIDELYDWIVSASIFAGYLTLSLHALGVGSCCLRKALFVESPSVKALRGYCNIPNDEQIVLELAIGFYKGHNKVPVSARKSTEQIVKYFDK